MGGYIESLVQHYLSEKAHADVVPQLRRIGGLHTSKYTPKWYAERGRGGGLRGLYTAVAKAFLQSGGNLRGGGERGR